MTVPALTGVLAATALVSYHEPAYRLQQRHWRALHQTRATVSHYTGAAIRYPPTSVPGECHPTTTDHTTKI
ncbi:hypothetical protein [Streptomyces sp. NPDC004376]